MNESILSLGKLLKNALEKYSDRTALVFGKKSMTYRELLEESIKVRNALKKHGAESNTPIALMMSNSLEYVISFIAVQLMGATVVPLNDMLGKKEIKYILTDSEAKIAIVGSTFFSVLEEIRSELPNLQTIVSSSSSDESPNWMIGWNEFKEENFVNDHFDQIDPNGRSVLVYTGGTTGLPKGVVHSQKNVAINMFSHVIELELHGNEKLLLTTPLPHSAGFVLMAGLLKGATAYIERNFDPTVVLEMIDKEKITLTFMVPTMIYRLMDQIESMNREFDSSSLRTIVYGAAPITESRLKQGLEIFGPVFTQLYGQTEAPNFITRLSKSDHIIDENTQHRLRSCGKAVLMAQVKVIDDHGNELSAGEVGEIVAKTPYNLVEYHKLPEKTQETLVDGWLHTGDIGYIDEEGYVYLLDRKNDMIISGGMNVYSTEVENVIQTHPSVNQVAVVGLPDEDWGEIVTAFIVRKENVTVSEEDIIKYCDSLLAKYKRPKKVFFIESLPLTTYGKIDKKALREPYWMDKSRKI